MEMRQEGELHMQLNLRLRLESLTRSLRFNDRFQRQVIGPVPDCGLTLP